MTAQIPPTDAAIEQMMADLGVDRETAITFMVRTFEATLRADEPTEKGIQRKLSELLLVDSRARAPWIIQMMQQQYRKELPGWVKLHDEALEAGQDPTTRMSIEKKVIMEIAESRIKLIKMMKDGKSIEEITEASFAEDDGRSNDEIYSLIAKQFS